MAKYDRFNRDKYAQTFDNLFGQGRFEQGINDARETGRVKVEATLARKAYQDQQKKLEKERKKQEEAAAKAASLAPSEGSRSGNTTKNAASGILGSLLGGVKKVGSEIARFDDRVGNALTFGLTGEADKRIQNQLQKKGKDVDLTSYQNAREKGDIAGKGLD